MMTLLKVLNHDLGCSTWRFAPLHGARVLLLNEAFLNSTTSRSMKIQVGNRIGRIVAFFSMEVHAAAAE
jgi:hypothetical protein